MRKLIPCLLYILLSLFSCNSDDSISQDKESLEVLKQAHAEFLHHTQETDVAYPLLEKVKELAEELNNNEYLAKYYAHYGLLKREEGFYGDAINAYHKALNLYGQNHDFLRQALALENIGYVYRKSEMYNRALQYFEQAEVIHLKLKTRDRIAGIYENIALTYMDQADYHSAEKYLHEGLKYAKDYNQEKESVLLNLFGKLHFLQGDYVKARDYYNRALTIIDNEAEKAYLYGNIGETYLKEGNKIDAEVWLKDAMEQKVRLENSDIRPNLNYMAELEIQKGNTQQALNHYHQVLEISTDDLYSDELDRAVTSLDKIYTENEQLIISDIERYKLFRKVFAAKNKYNKESREEMETLYHQASLRVVESDAQHKETERQYEKETYTLQMSAMITTFLVILFCGLTIFIIRKYRKNKMRLNGYQAGLKTMMDEYGAKNVAELQKILSQLAR